MGILGGGVVAVNLFGYYQEITLAKTYLVPVAGFFASNFLQIPLQLSCGILFRDIFLIHLPKFAVVLFPSLLIT